jgi:hypothetical protein
MGSINTAFATSIRSRIRSISTDWRKSILSRLESFSSRSHEPGLPSTESEPDGSISPPEQQPMALYPSFDPNYQENLWKRWKRSETALERECLAIEGYRVFFELQRKDKLHQRDGLRRAVRGEIKRYAEHQDLKEGWQSYIDFLDVVKVGPPPKGSSPLTDRKRADPLCTHCY